MEKKSLKRKKIPAEADIQKFISFFEQYGRITDKWAEKIIESDEFIRGSHHQVMNIEIELEKYIPSPYYLF